MERHRILLLAASLSLADDPAHASGFQLREVSGEGLGNAFAGSTAKADDVATLFHNPAGMTRLDGDQAGVSAAWIVPYSRFQGTGPAAGSNGGNHLQGVLVPAAYLMWDTAEDWRLGLAITAPFGMRSDYDEDWVGRYHALDSALNTVNVSPSVAFRVNERLSLAAGAQVEWIRTLLSNAVNFGALVPGAGDGLFRVRSEDVGMGWTASALWEMDHRTRAGFAYRSTIRHELHGDAAFEGVPAALAANPAFAGGETHSVLTLPDTATLGIHHELDRRWAVMADVSWTGWSVFQTLRLEFADGRPGLVQPQNWHDTWFGALGATYRPSETVSLHVGTAYDITPVDDQYRNARIPDADRVWLSGGVNYTPAPGQRFSLSYTHIFGGSASIDQRDPVAGRLTGEYDNHVDLFGLMVTLRF